MLQTIPYARYADVDLDAAPEFTGPRAGWHFGKDLNGVGYYREQAVPVQGAEAHHRMRAASVLWPTRLQLAHLATGPLLRQWRDEACSIAHADEAAWSQWRTLSWKTWASNA